MAIVNIPARIVWGVVMLLPNCLAAADAPAQTPSTSETDSTAQQILAAVERALPLLERASAGSADQRTCFTCHSQALPVLAMVESQRRGFSANAANLKRQIDHTHSHLLRGRQSYQEGRGQGGGADTAGYALWTLEEGNWPRDDVTTTVAEWLLTKQSDDGHWACSSHRPPSEASDWTTTYLALRALSAFGTPAQQDAIELATKAAARWLATADAKDTEDQVFRLLSLGYVDVPDDVADDAIDRLAQAQRDDGGWSQLPGMDSDAYATATALYALRQARALDVQDSMWTRAVHFLLDQQLEDGSWLVKSRSKPFQTYFESGFPHGKDQYISTAATGWATVVLLQSLPEKAAPQIDVLAGTKPLDWPEADLSPRLMHAAHTFVEAQIKRVNESRQAVRGNTDTAQALRQELLTMLGVVEDRLPPRMEYFGEEQDPAIVAENDAYQVFQARWPVFANVMGEGLRVKQRGQSIGRVVVIPDADQSPEEMLGLRTDHARQASAMQPIARWLADNGFDVIVVAIVSRAKMQTDNPQLQRADYTDREWIYRQAFQMGRHVIGYDIQRVLAAVDWFDRQASGETRLGVIGYGEGGLVALHAAAVDPRVDVALVSGYFDRSDAVWKEPIYRNVMSRLNRFGNAEVAALIQPRQLLIEHAPFPAVTGHKGDLATPEFKDVKAEFDRIPRAECCQLITGPEDGVVGPWSREAVEPFVRHLGLTSLQPASSESLGHPNASTEERLRARQRRATGQLETHVQSLVRGSEHVRDDYFLYRAMPEFRDSRWSTERQHPTFDAEKFIAAAKSYRQQFHEQAMGRFDEPLLPPNARTRQLIETDQWTAYDVVLDVHEGLFSWGVLVLPKDLGPEERRPVVVCQHGRNGVPRDTIDAGTTAYNDFAARLAERGFITFAPHNLYRGEDQYRWLDRKANTIGCTLFSLIIPQHDALLRWLDSLPFVDGERIAFYGLSYGGESAMRVPTVLEKYCLSICSGDFNQWTRKVAATDQPFSFMNTIEWEMPYWNLGHTFDYAEMAYLMFPRPLMVERGHLDRVGRDNWVAHEFAKVRWLYAQFGMVDRVGIEFFQGGHSIRGEGTFQFLEDHLGSFEK